MGLAANVLVPVAGYRVLLLSQTGDAFGRPGFNYAGARVENFLEGADRPRPACLRYSQGTTCSALYS